MSDIYQILSNLGISYKKFDHPAVYTCEEADKYCQHVEGGETKNLFLCNDKRTKYYLVTLPGRKKADLKKLAALLNERRLSFSSPDRLKEKLNLTPGSVSIFGLINNPAQEVVVVVDNDLLKLETLGYHPNINTATLVISINDFKIFLESTGHQVVYTNL